MGCGSTSMKTMKDTMIKHEEKKKIYMYAAAEVQLFLEKNPQILKRLENLGDSEMIETAEKFRFEIESNGLKVHWVVREMLKPETQKVLSQLLLSRPIAEEFSNVVYHIKQLDSDFKYFKDLVGFSKSFHNPSSEAGLVFDIHKISEIHIPFVIEQLKYVYFNLECITIILYLSNISTNVSYLKALADIFPILTRLISVSIIIKNDLQSKDYITFDINFLDSVLQELRLGGLKNFWLGCVNCRGELNDNTMSTLLSLLSSKNFFMFGLSNISLGNSVLQSLMNGISRQKQLNLFSYECPEDLSFNERSAQLKLLGDTLKNTDCIRLVYLFGYDECDKEDKQSARSKIRKNGIVKEVVIDVPIRNIFDKYAASN